MKFIIISLITVLGSSPFVFANWQGWSIWKGNHVAENSIAGTVKTIAIDDEADRLIVKVKTADGSIETARVCYESIQSAKNQLHGSPQLAMLKSAMSSGFHVSLAFSSRFDRCIEDIRIQNTLPSRGVRKASTQDNDFRELSY